MGRPHELRSPISIDLPGRSCRPGESVVVLFDGAAGPARVALVRIERRPCGEDVFVVDERFLGEPYGLVELALSTGALPTVGGTGCALSYAVQVRAGDLVTSAGLEVCAAGGRPHVMRGSCGRDPLIADWDARHFHLELEDASLCGDGWIAGRLHRHGSGPQMTIAVRARCDECWRPRGPAARGMPFWREETLWEAQARIELDPDTPWAPVRFDLPPGLPPALEARTIAWRYELRASRPRRLGPDETAALTPLMFGTP